MIHLPKTDIQPVDKRLISEYELLSLISPVEAVIITTSMPILALFFERKLNQKPTDIYTLAMSITVCLFAALSITLSSDSKFGGIRVGHLEMLLAVVSFAAHTVYYKSKVIDKTPTLPLSIQFIISAALMLPFLPQRVIADFFSLNITEWIRFGIYSVICGLGPFILMHYCLKKYDPFIILTVSLLSPLFAILFRGIYQFTPISIGFVLATTTTCLLAAATLALNKRNNLHKKGHS